MVLKTTIWDTSDEEGKAKIEHANSLHAATIVSEFPVLTEGVGSKESPGLTGMHAVWGCRSFQTALTDIENEMANDIAAKMRMGWDELEEDEKEEFKASIRCPSLRQYLEWSPGRSLDKMVADFYSKEPKEVSNLPIEFFFFFCNT